MRMPSYTRQFERDLQRMLKRGKDAVMAQDPYMQRELQAIEAEFAVALAGRRKAVPLPRILEKIPRRR